MSYRAAFTAINDWAYFNRLLSYQFVADKLTTKAFCWALVRDDKGYCWWKLRRSNYKVIKTK